MTDSFRFRFRDSDSPAYVLSGGDSFLNVIHDVFKSKCSWILTKHSIAPWVILDLSSVFIEHDSHRLSKPGYMAMLLFFRLS
jgi:hypothetical protein